MRRWLKHMRGVNLEPYPIEITLQPKRKMQPEPTVASQCDERPMPRVARRCKRCHNPTWKDVANGNVVVSPRGTAHHGQDDGETDCGIDATGPKWWWRL